VSYTPQHGITQRDTLYRRLADGRYQPVPAVVPKTSLDQLLEMVRRLRTELIELHADNADLQRRLEQRK
jgi:hypothetical protein